ncbi:MAG: serine hydrolase, partial [Burkholderiaceae bacterium]
MIASTINQIAPAQTMPNIGGVAQLPDNWLLARYGNSWWYETKPGVEPVTLNNRTASNAELSVVSRARQLLAVRSAKAIALVDGADIVYIEYKQPANESSVFFGASVGKTMTAMAVGKAICAGKLTFETKASDLVPELAQKPLGIATVRDLLRMASGAAEPASDSTIMTQQQAADWQRGELKLVDLVSSDKISQAARGVFSTYSPGEHFSYKSTDPITL